MLERGKGRAVAALVIVTAVVVGVGIYVHNFTGRGPSESGEDVGVLWISSIAMDEQSQGKMVVKFKNTGETPTDFSISVDPPKPVFVKDNPSPVSLDSGEIASVTVTLGAEAVEEDEGGFGEVTVTATETQGSDSLEFQASVNNLEEENRFVSSNLEREENPDVSQDQISELVDGNTRFAFDLYRQIMDEEGNLFYSPYSISTALSMTYAGAKGETAQQMGDTLHFTLPRGQLHPSFNALSQSLEDRENFTLTLTNALWGQENWRFKEDFLDTLALNYGAGMHRLDFEEKPEQARRIVNEWVENHTENKIENLIPRGAFKGLPTVLVLTNAIYFQAPWASSFSEDLTQEKSFTLLNGENVEVPMMSSGSRPFLCTEGKNYKAVKIHYLGNASMTVILPDEGYFREVERDLDTEFVEGVSENLKSRTVVLEMPKFSFESKFDLSDALKEMGMPKAFTDEANFSGMTPDTPVWIDQVLHQAYISVDEKGTEAAAATSVEMVVGIGSNITLNRPFIFLIRDDETGTVLFAGCVVNPVS